MGRSSAGIDFYQMWVGPRIARQTTTFYEPATRAAMGEEYVRRAETEEQSPRRLAVARHRRNLELLSTPMLYTLFAPLAGSYERDLLLFQLAMLAALIAWAALFGRAFGYGLLQALLLFDVLVLAFEPVRSDARAVNVNHGVLLLLAIAAMLTVRRRLFLAGAVIAVAVLFKPYAILVLPLMWAIWMVHRRWSELRASVAGAAVGGVAGLIVTSLYFRSPSIWFDWLREFRAMPGEMIPLDVGNFAFSPLLQTSIGVPSWVIWLAVLIAAGIVVLRSRYSETTDLLAIALGLVVFQLGSPLVWVHHLLMTVPLLMFLMRPAAEGEMPRAVAARQIAGGVALFLIAIEPWASIVPTMLQVALIANTGLLIAFVSALRALRHMPNRTPATTLLEGDA